MLSKSLLPECQRNSERQFSLLMPSLNCGDSQLEVPHSSRNVGSISHIPYVPMGKKKILSTQNSFKYLLSEAHEPCIETTHFSSKQITHICRIAGCQQNLIFLPTLWQQQQLPRSFEPFISKAYTHLLEMSLNNLY